MLRLTPAACIGFGITVSCQHRRRAIKSNDVVLGMKTSHEAQGSSSRPRNTWLLAAALSSGIQGTAGKKEESLGRNNVKFLRVQSTETELASPSGVLYLWCRCCVMAFPLLVSEKVDVGVNLPTLRVLPGRLH
jgi:hypothetical protein